MRKFNYVVSTTDGVTEKGYIHAPTEQDAADKLREDGKVIISIIEEAHLREWFWEKPHLGFSEKIMFVENLATMMKVGITVMEAMEILKTQMKGANNKRMFDNIMAMIRSGQSLSKTLGEYKKIFSDVFINMIAVGEESGTLEKTLEYLEKQLNRDYNLRKQVISAFIYPAFIVSLTLMMTLGMVVFILPKITKMFTSFDVVLPLPTRILIGTSTFLTTKPIMAILLIGGVVGLIYFLVTTKYLKLIRDKFILRIPIFGRLARDMNLARFSRMMTSLLQAGVPITKSLSITASMLTSKPYQDAVEKTREMVEKGGTLGEAFAQNEKLFPTLASKLLFIGEKTGSLETTTAHLANMYEKKVSDLTKNLSVLLEPLLLVFMGALVGGVAISVILPIYQLPNLIAK
jgi:type IV pilus assembly protein PilC